MNAKQLVTIGIFTIMGCLMVQAELNLPKKNIGSETYYYYKVQSNETLSNIAEKIGVSVEDIVKFNPSANNGISKKQLLFLPVSAFSQSNNNAPLNTNEVTHTVKKGETLYGISKIYNISVDELVKANPEATKGLTSGQVIVIPVNLSTNENNVVYHTISNGESLYSVSNSYNTTIEKLLELNPGITPNCFRVGDVIKVQPNATAVITVKQNIKQIVAYSVKEGDTYQSIANSFKINITDLQKANSEVKKLKRGLIIYIPKEAIATSSINTSKVSAKELEQTYSGKLEQVYEEVHQVNKNKEINIAMILPFQLHKSDPPRQAYLYTDFYKGFLLAIDSINNKFKMKVNLNVYDTEHNLNKTDSILALKELKNMDVIIAPGEPKQLERCNNFGKENNITVINCFSSKNEDYNENNKVVQLNMPTSLMTSEVYDWIEQNFKEFRIFFIEDPENDDITNYNEIKSKTILKNKKFHNLKVTEGIDYNIISDYMDPGVNYLFIPSSSRKSFLSKILPTINEVKSKRFDCEISLLCFPECLTYYKEFKSTFQTIDTYIFSRFFIANENRAEKIYQKFKENYDENMINTTPTFGLLGFDLGCYILESYKKNGEISNRSDYFDGIQMDIKLERTCNWGGMTNNCLEMVHFSNTNVSESIIK